MKTIVIAEIGMTHDGSFGQAKAMIQCAAKCGANIVKFQTHISEAETLPNAPRPPYFKDESRYEYFDRTAFSLEQHIQLKEIAEQAGVEFISSPFSIEAIELLEKVGVKSYKIPSGEVTNIPYLIRMAETGKQVILSSGMSSWAELDEAVKTLQDNGCDDLVILQCTSEYPCPPEAAGLNIMLEMKERYGFPVGYSDHTLGSSVAVAAVTLGACLIEKHFTLSHAMYGPDAKNSADPDELKTLVENIRAAEKALNSTVDKDSKANELNHMKITFEKSLVAACDLPANTIIEIEHLAYKKPGDGIPARRYQEFIGKTLMVPVEKNSKFEEKHFIS